MRLPFPFGLDGVPLIRRRQNQLLEGRAVVVPVPLLLNVVATLSALRLQVEQNCPGFAIIDRSEQRKLRQIELHLPLVGQRLFYFWILRLVFVDAGPPAAEQSRRR